MKINLPVLAASMLIKEGANWLINRIKKAWRKRKARKKLKNRSQLKKMNFPK
jgi:hypothetical protein